jgi:hypothetical protein
MNIKLISKIILVLSILVSCNQPTTNNQTRILAKDSEGTTTIELSSIDSNAIKNSQEFIGNDSKVKLPLNKYRSEGYIIKDSLGLIYNDSTQAVILTLVKQDERKIEFKSQTDAPVKRLFLLFNKNGNKFDNVITNYNLLPNLEYGGRSDIGYYHLTTKKDSFSFNSLIFPDSSNDQYEINFEFVFNTTDKEWYFDHCIIFEYTEDDVVPIKTVNRDDFGKILAKDFDIYEFNPFIFVK